MGHVKIRFLHGPCGNQISAWAMWKSDFFSLVQTNFTIFLKMYGNFSMTIAYTNSYRNKDFSLSSNSDHWSNCQGILQFMGFLSHRSWSCPYQYQLGYEISREQGREVTPNYLLQMPMLSAHSTTSWDQQSAALVLLLIVKPTFCQNPNQYWDKYKMSRRLRILVFNQFLMDNFHFPSLCEVKILHMSSFNNWEDLKKRILFINLHT